LLVSRIYRKNGILKKEMSNILKAIIRRIANEEHPGGFSDNKKITLSIEGGKLSCVIGAGCSSGIETVQSLIPLLHTHDGDLSAAFQTLQNRSLTKQRNVSCFDGVYCTSGGGPIGAYFLTGQAVSGTTIFSENLTSRDFFDIKRGFAYAAGEILGLKPSAPPIMNVDFFIDIMSGLSGDEKKLNIDAFKQSKTPLYFAVTNLDTMRRELISPGPDSLFSSVKAACFIPGLAGKPPVHQGRLRYVDARTSPIDLIPKETDYVLAIGSRPIGSSTKKTGRSKGITTLMDQLSPLALGRQEGARYLKFVRDQRCVSANFVAASQNQRGRYVYLGMPEGSRKLSDLCTNPDRLMSFGTSAYLNTLEIFRAPLIQDGLVLKNKQAPFSPPTRWASSFSTPQI